MAGYTKIPAKNKQGYKWVCTLDGPPDPITGKRNQVARRGDTQKEAKAKAEAVIAALTNHGINSKKVKKLSFEEVAWDWHRSYSKGPVKASTVRIREKEIKILLRYIPKVIIDKITHKQHQEIIYDLDDKGYARTTIEGVHITANMIYKFAIKHKMRIDNPCTGTIIPVKLLTVEEIENMPLEEKYFEKEEIAEFLSAVQQYGEFQDIEIFYLFVFSGLRSGELCAIKETDFNFEMNEVRITKTLYNPDNNMRKYSLTPPKTKGSIRTFTLDEAVMNLIKNLIDEKKKLRENYKEAYSDYHDQGFLFSHENGYPFIPKNMIMRMERLLKKTSITKQATPHIFRHTHISMLVEAGVDLKTIMQRVGHEDSETTLKIYTHITNKMKKDADQKIKNHFSDILNIDSLPKM